MYNFLHSPKVLIVSIASFLNTFEIELVIIIFGSLSILFEKEYSPTTVALKRKVNIIGIYCCVMVIDKSDHKEYLGKEINLYATFNTSLSKENSENENSVKNKKVTDKATPNINPKTNPLLIFIYPNKIVKRVLEITCKALENAIFLYFLFL